MKKQSKWLSLKIFRFLLLLAFFVVLEDANTETIKILNVDAKNYPKMKAEISVSTGSGDEIRTFGNTDIKVFDGGKERVASTVYCTPNVRKFSLIITVDKTASMQYSPQDDGSGTNTTPPLKRDIAISSARKLIEVLPFDRSECALTEFSAGPQATRQIMFFSQDRDSLKSEIGKIAFGGGTDINSGFLGKNGGRGAINVAEYARWKPIIVFITDGLHDPNFTTPKGEALKTGEIIAQAKAINASVFMVGLGVSLSADMQSIATGTGGKVYNNLSEQAQLDGALAQIMQLASKDGNLAPCEVEWDTDCSGGDLTMTYQQGNKPSDNIQYTLIPETLPKLTTNPINPNTVLNVAIGSSQLIDVEIKAEQNDLTVTGDVSNKGVFKVVNWGGKLPLMLKKGETRKIQIEYKPNSVECVEDELTFLSDACEIGKFNLKGGTIIIEDIDAGGATKNQPKQGVYTAKFCNRSCSDIEITGFEVKGADAAEFQINNKPTTLKSGQCLDIDLTYTPSDVRASMATYVIKTKNNNVFTAILRGTGSGLAKIQAEDLTFDAIKCGEVTKDVVVKNTGAIPLIITSVKLTNIVDFSFVGIPPSVVLPGSSEIISIKFDPKGVGPDYGSDLVIDNDSDNDKTKTVKITASRYEIDFTTNIGAGVDFGIVCPDEKVSKSFEITNLTKTTITLTGSSVLGTGFTVNPNTWTLAPDEKATVVIQFSGTNDGNYTGTWTLLDECNKKVLNYALKAEVVEPLLTAPVTNFSATLGGFDEKLIRVTNPTNRDITFDAVSDNTQYTIVKPSPATAVTLPKNSFMDFTVRFTPIFGGSPNGKIDIVTTSCGYSTSLSLVGDPKFATADIIIDTTYTGLIGDMITIPVKIRNKKAVDASGAKKITVGLDIDANLLLPDGTTPVGVINGDTRRVVFDFTLDGTNNNQDFNLSFKIQDALAAYTYLVFYTTPKVDNDAIAITTYNGKFTTTIAKAEAKIYQTSAKPGEIFDFPIYIRDKNAYLKAFHKGIRTHLRFNASVLEPVGIPSSIVNGDQNIREIEVTQMLNFVSLGGDNNILSPDPSDKLVSTIKFKAMLGNAEISKVYIINSTTLEGKVDISPDSTEFTLLGVCKDLDGTLRLINPFAPNPGIFVTPNPVNDDFSINVTSIEKGIHSIKIYDLLGNLKEEIFDGDLEPSNHTFLVDRSSVEAGTYFIVFTTPTQKFTKTVNFVK